MAELDSGLIRLNQYDLSGVGCQSVHLMDGNAANRKSSIMGYNTRRSNLRSCVLQQASIGPKMKYAVFRAWNNIG